MREAHLIRGLAALLGLLALLVGLPVALAVVAGWPLPRGLPSLASLRQALEEGWSPDAIVVIKALAIVCWVAWVEVAACAVVEVSAALRGRRQAPKVPLAGPLQPFIAHLVTAILLAVSGTGTRATPVRPPSLAEAVTQYSLVPPSLVSTTPEPSPPLRVTPVAASRAPAPKIVVRPRDDLWDLAERHLGDSLRWREIWELNRGRSQPGGRFLEDPDLIRPGWILELPADAAGVEEVAAPGTGIPVPQDSRPGAAPPPLPVGQPAIPAVPEPRPEQPERSQGPERRPEGPPVSVELPSGSVVAASFAAGIAAALATARLRRRRRYRPSPPGPALSRPASDVGPATRALVRNAPPAGSGTAGPDAREAPPPFPFRGLRDPEPARLEIGVRGDHPVEVELTGLGGLALDGPGAAGVTRALVAALLARGSPYVTRLLVPEPTADRLLAGIGKVAGVRVVADLDAALEEAEVELLRRARLLDVEDVSDFATHRRRHPDDPLPAVVMVIDEAIPHRQGRLRAVAEQGKGAGLGMMVIGSNPGCGARLHVDGSGRLTEIAPDSLAAALSEARLYRLGGDEFAEVVGVLAAAREEAPASAESAALDYLPAATTPPEPEEVVTPPAAGSSLTVHLLGPYRIEVGGKEIRTGLRSGARELLAYYLLRPEGASLEAAVDALWPDVDLARGPERFWTALGNLRSRVRKATGVELPLIDKEGEDYRVQGGVFDVDVWRFRAALAGAREASDEQAVTAALEQAAAAYGGELLEGKYYDWVEPAREEFRRRALDALVRLAELRRSAGDTEGALAAIEQAIGVNPYAEELYRRAISLLSELDRIDVARQLFRQLGARLSDLDVEPEEETGRLLHALATKDAARRRAGEGRARPHDLDR